MGPLFELKKDMSPGCCLQEALIAQTSWRHGRTNDYQCEYEESEKHTSTTCPNSPKA